MGCSRGSATEIRRPRLGAHGQMGWPIAKHSRGSELPLAYASRRGLAAFRLENPVLEFSSQAREAQAVMDDPGAAGTGNGSVPLDQSEALRARTRPPSDVSGRLRIRLRSCGGSAHAWKR